MLKGIGRWRMLMTRLMTVGCTSLLMAIPLWTIKSIAGIFADRAKALAEQERTSWLGNFGGKGKRIPPRPAPDKLAAIPPCPARDAACRNCSALHRCGGLAESFGGAVNLTSECWGGDIAVWTEGSYELAYYPLIYRSRIDAWNLYS